MKPSTDTPTGQRIGRYVLFGRVGRGGMGEVHRARAFAAAGATKDLCIKRIRKSRLAQGRALSRFVQEARLWMRLSHANIVQVFDFGRIENDYYLAMEWVDGCDLRALLEDADAREAPLAEEEALYLAGEIARALAYLHDEGVGGRAVAHCDLKPGNVLVSKKSEVKLADFGVAVAAESARAGGTRGYIPPSEQGEHVGTQADLYAFGRVIDELARRTTAGEGERLLSQIAADLQSTSPTRASAGTIEAELEAALARARVRASRSPRELLGARVAAVPRVEELGGEESVETQASFLAAQDEASFLERMEGGSELSTSSRSTPMPQPVPGPARPRPTWAPLLAVVVAVAAFALWPRAPEPLPALEPRAVTAAPPPPAPSAPAGAEVAPAAPAEVVPPEAPIHAERPRPRPTVTEPASVETAPIEPATLRVNARPWAEVEVDGVARGVTPLRSLSLPPGHHVVHLRNPATGREETSELDLSAGERRDVIVDLR